MLFDCDGVLVDSEVLAQEIETDVLGALGLHYERDDYCTRFLGMSDAAFFAALEQDGLSRLGRSIESEIRTSIKSRMREAVAARLTEVPGAVKAVASLAHIKAVASSSTTQGLETKLRKTGLWNYFAPHIYSADHVTHAKPAPDLFLYAANALDIAPARCLVIEDSVNGVLAARAAGMTAWGFLGGGHHIITSGQRLMDAGAQRLVIDWPEAARLFATL